MMTEKACCEYLKEGNPDFCDALDKPYMPDAFRMEEYCRCSNYKSCPFHMYWAYRKTYFDQRRPRDGRGHRGNA